MRSPILFLALLILSFGSIDSANAQLSKSDEQSRTETENPIFDHLEPLTAEGLKNLMFPQTLNGCARWAAFVYATSEQYAAGQTDNQVSPMKMLTSIKNEVHEQVRTKGLSQTKIDNIKSYNACIKEAERDSKTKQKPCINTNEVVLGTLSAIAKKTSQTSTIKKFGNKKINTQGTVMERIENPVEFIIGRLYQTAQKQSLDETINAGAAISLGCITRVR
jgi:hypothetical protein